MSSTGYGVIGCKILAKALLNTAAPGSGAAVEFAAAAMDLYYGNVTGGILNSLSGVADLVTLGMSGVAKDAMKEGAKGAVIQTAKETAKTVGKEGRKKVGQQVGKELAQGVLNEAVGEVFSKGTKNTAKSMATFAFLSALSSGRVDVFKTMSGDLGEEWLTSIVQKALSEKAKKFTFEFTKKAAITGAEKEFQKYAAKIFVKDVGFAVSKGMVNYSSRLNDPNFIVLSK